MEEINGFVRHIKFELSVISFFIHFDTLFLKF